MNCLFITIQRRVGKAHNSEINIKRTIEMSFFFTDSEEFKLARKFAPCHIGFWESIQNIKIVKDSILR